MTVRRLTQAAVAAETALIRLRASRARSLLDAEMRWAIKLRDLVNSYPDDVLRVLLATGVIEEQDIDPRRLPLKEGT